MQLLGTFFCQPLQKSVRDKPLSRDKINVFLQSTTLIFYGDSGKNSQKSQIITAVG